MYSFYCNVQKLAGATLLVLANKQDVKGAMSPHEIEQVLVKSMKSSLSMPMSESQHENSMDNEKDDSTAKVCENSSKTQLPRRSQRHWRVQACSAVNGNGLLEGFDWLVRDIGSRIFMFEQ